MSEPLVTFFPIGRLGNNMFQAAAAIGYAKRHGVKWGAPLNMRETPEFHKWFPGLPICSMQYRTYQEHPAGMCRHHNQHYDDCHFNYHPIPFVHGGVKLMGFFQSWKYFEGAENEVRSAFRLKEYPELKDYVSIHVRRTDYVTHSQSFPPIPKEYVTKALTEVPTANIRGVMVFSDDIEWCKETWGTQFEYSEGYSTIEDMARMASCQHNIIANSTFSYWSAWLNQNQNKVIVSPSHKRGCWFGHQSGVRQDCIDLIPPTWKQIEF